MLTLLCGGLSACGSTDQIRYEQFMINGEQHYLLHCANCHQRDGKGLRDLYPPIAGSDFLKDRKRVVCVIRHGMSGPVTVKGKTYNQAMPANQQLYETDIAELVTYIYGRWGDVDAIIPADTIRGILENCQVSE